MANIKNKIKLLILEDSEDDTKLLVRHLEKGGLEPIYQRVETKKSLDEALENNEWDIIIVDYVLPSFSGISALKEIQSKGIDTPVILISGNVSEEIAVEAMESGAKDCLMKDNLIRLIPAIKRELRNVENIKAQQIQSAERPSLLESLDEVDKEIIRLLREDGRMKLVDIGKSMLLDKKDKYSHVAVKNRITKLLENDVIKIQSNYNLFYTDHVIGIQMLEINNQENRREITDNLKKCPRIIFAFETTGNFNIIYGVIANGIQDLQYFLNNCAPKFFKNIHNSQTLISSKTISPKYYPLDLKVLIDKPDNCDTCF